MRKKGSFAVAATAVLAALVVTVQLFLWRADTRSLFLPSVLREHPRAAKPRLATLVFESERPEAGVSILINGKKEKNFLQKKIKISVPQYSVIELKKEGVSHPVNVEITGVSGFVRSELLNRKWRGEKNFFRVGRILFQ